MKMSTKKYKRSLQFKSSPQWECDSTELKIKKLLSGNRQRVWNKTMQFHHHHPDHPYAHRSSSWSSSSLTELDSWLVIKGMTTMNLAKTQKFDFKKDVSRPCVSNNWDGTHLQQNKNLSLQNNYAWPADQNTLVSGKRTNTWTTELSLSNHYAWPANEYF